MFIIIINRRTSQFHYTFWGDAGSTLQNFDILRLLLKRCDSSSWCTQNGSNFQLKYVTSLHSFRCLQNLYFCVKRKKGVSFLFCPFCYRSWRREINFPFIPIFYKFLDESLPSKTSHIQSSIQDCKCFSSIFLITNGAEIYNIHLCINWNLFYWILTHIFTWLVSLGGAG